MPRRRQRRAMARRMRPPASLPRETLKPGRRHRPDAAAPFCGLRFGWIAAQALCCRPMKRVSIAVLLVSLCATPVLATTYVRVEPDGSKTYSDRPLPGGHEVDIQSAQTYSAPPP